MEGNREKFRSSPHRNLECKEGYVIEKGAFWQINQLSPGRCTITEKWRVAGAISLNRGKLPLVDSTVDAATAAALMTL